MRCAVLWALMACSSNGKPPPPKVVPHASDAAIAVSVDAGPPLPAHQAYPDLAAAISVTVPADTRVVGFGELHARVDRAQVRSALSLFTAALPSFGTKISDLVVETWIVDPKCGQKAVETTAKVEKNVKRPEATKSEIGLLADAAKAANIQPHAMTLQCKDYEKLAPKNGEADPIAMLALTTKELQRIAQSAVKHRDKDPTHRPWVALYGGALHNDRFPGAGVAEWSYAETIDLATDGKYVEIDLIVPELAEADSVSQQQPWFPLVAAANRVLVWKRGERSFVIVLPRTKT
ncbi:MAG: hypothetical protein M4D80_39370 [Myxococcota bacterium]|nr:hypothetical protein [Deltaproteobacteria bacterium]MDQ3341254.1 hypothetical protein [Myxococcota bacterium]